MKLVLNDNYDVVQLILIILKKNRNDFKKVAVFCETIKVIYKFKTLNKNKIYSCKKTQN